MQMKKERKKDMIQQEKLLSKGYQEYQILKILSLAVDDS